MTKILFVLASSISLLIHHPLEAVSEDIVVDKVIDDAELDTPILDISAMPNTVVGGVVNIISGNFVDNACDLVIPGANALTIQRYFNSAGNDKGNFWHGWDLNLPSDITVQLEGMVNYAYVNDRGARLEFKEVDTKKSMNIDNNILKYGVTNCNSGTLSSLSNMKNKKLKYKINSDHCELLDESGEKLYYKKYSKKKSKTKFAVSENVLPTGCSYLYDYDKQNRISKIISAGIKKNELSYIKWVYPDDFNKTPKITLISPDGRKNRYKFLKTQMPGETDSRFSLESVVRDHAPNITYTYQEPTKHVPVRLVKKELPDSRFLKIKYYEKGKNKFGNENISISDHNDCRIGRVLALYEPAGIDDSPILTWRFKYTSDGNYLSKYVKGKAEAIDALGHKKVYSFSDEQRLTSISHFLDNGQLYRKEKMTWGTREETQTFLTSKSILDQNGNVLTQTDYAYDDAGNVLRETLKGNLTGLKDNNKKDQDDKIESFSKTFTYTNDGLLESEIVGRRKTVYKYIPNSNLLRLKLVYGDKQLCERYYYSYDNNCVMIKEIVDDGNSSDIKNLAGVTQRLIKEIAPTKTQPIGLPKTIKEKYLDLSTDQEFLLNVIENTYSIEGNLVKQDVYDRENTFQYSKTWDYDLHGNVTREVDPLGRETTYQYDENNNRIHQQTPNLAHYTTYQYDYMNRLISKQEIHNSGLKLSNSYTYDYMGNRTSCTDEYGNTTKFVYDEFGRMIKKIHPLIFSPRGILEELSDNVSYDCLNNPCEKIDTNGHKVKRLFTARNQPYRIELSDGSVEKCIYRLDGTLEKTIDAKGVETHFTVDYQGRKTCEEKISPDGESLSKRYWKYNAFHLIEETDSDGTITFYTYDEAGRQIRVRKGFAETRCVYDSIGRKSEIWELYEPEKYRRTIFKYDSANRIIHESVQDESQNIFLQKSYQYDCDDNCTHLIIHSDEGDVCTQTYFNSFKQPIKIIQPDGFQTIFSYSYTYINDFLQKVPSITEMDPKGNQNIKILDSLGRLSKEILKDASGKLLQSSYYFHDGEGNLFKRIDDLIIDGEIIRKIELHYKFNHLNKEVEIREAAGDALEKVTRNEYNRSGELTVITKPDGIKLFHEYDFLGRLTNLYSSDNSIHYSYIYDLKGNITSVIDHGLGLETSRLYDENNRMVYEKLSTGLEYHFQYDALSRIRQVVFPDTSSIEYIYNASNLVSVNRMKNGNEYLTRYAFNTAGKISSVSMPNAAANIFYTYDSSLRPQTIECPHFTQHIAEDGYDCCGNVVRVVQKDIIGEWTSDFEYDGLHHLIAETGIKGITYRYDSMHNRISKNGITHSLNVLNQLIQQADKIYEYDPNGNQAKKTTESQRWEYQYDALDRLTAVICGNSKTVYVYDAFHRRLKKTQYTLQNEHWVEIDSITFLYQGDKEIGALSKKGKIVEMRTLGLGINGEIGAATLLEIGDQALIPLHDFRGNVVSVLNMDDGKPVECYRYTAYGEEQLFDNNGDIQSTALSPWRFSSKRIDAETGWYFYGRRYYDPEIGKWTTPDPLGFKDCRNSYCFVRNRPMIYIDSDGQFFSELCENFGRKYEVFGRACSRWIDFNDEDYTFYSVFRPKNESAVYKVGNPHEGKFKITFINGILNDKAGAEASAEIVSNMAGGREVMYIHNTSFGALDLVECGINLCGIQTPPSMLLVKTWTDILQDPEMQILHPAHSQGMLHTKLALRQMDPEMKSRITVVGIAPAGILNEDDCGDAVHYVSETDFVPWFDRWYSANPNFAPIITLKPAAGAKFVDHNFASDTFLQPLKDEIFNFVYIYGNDS